MAARKKLLGCEAVADKLGVTRMTLYAWRKAGTGPPWVRIGKSLVRYPSDKLAEWLEQNTTSNKPSTNESDK